MMRSYYGPSLSINTYSTHKIFKKDIKHQDRIVIPNPMHMIGILDLMFICMETLGSNRIQT